MIIIQPIHEFSLTFKSGNGGKETKRVIFIRKVQDKEMYIFQYDAGEKANGLLIAHKSDILSIRVKTWDNTKKEEGTKRISLEELIEHLN